MCAFGKDHALRVCCGAERTLPTKTRSAPKMSATIGIVFFRGHKSSSSQLHVLGTVRNLSSQLPSLALPQHICIYISTAKKHAKDDMASAFLLMSSPSRIEVRFPKRHGLRIYRLLNVETCNDIKSVFRNDYYAELCCVLQPDFRNDEKRALQKDYYPVPYCLLA
jgi:hypothetical protein